MRLRPGTAAVIKVAKDQSIAVVTEAGIMAKVVEGLEVEPGRYVVVPAQMWEQTVRAAMLAAEAPPPADDALPPTRQQRRRARFDA